MQRVSLETGEAGAVDWPVSSSSQSALGSKTTGPAIICTAHAKSGVDGASEHPHRPHCFSDGDGHSPLAMVVE